MARQNERQVIAFAVLCQNVSSGCNYLQPVEFPVRESYPNTNHNIKHLAHLTSSKRMAQASKSPFPRGIQGDSCPLRPSANPPGPLSKGELSVQTRSSDAKTSENPQRLDSLVGFPRRVIQPRSCFHPPNVAMPDRTTSPERRLVISRQTRKGQYFTEPLSENVSLQMMLIPAGSFQMGSPADELDNYEDEQPQHGVTVPSFFIARTPITQAQWRAVTAYPKAQRDLDSDPSHFKGDNRPVERVSWDDATEFCQRLSQKTGRTYRLPSEAEWEYACRAGTTTPFHFGETISDELANYCASEIYGRGIAGEYRETTTEVGQFPANDWGLYDMHGNVLEWCEDDWHSSYEDAPSNGSAWIEADRSETTRVLRGGSWNYGPGGCRSAYRFSNSRDIRNVNFGFRVCCLPPRTS